MACVRPQMRTVFQVSMEDVNNAKRDFILILLVFVSNYHLIVHLLTSKLVNALNVQLDFKYQLLEGPVSRKLWSKIVRFMIPKILLDVSFANMATIQVLTSVRKFLPSAKSTMSKMEIVFLVYQLTINYLMENAEIQTVRLLGPMVKCAPNVFLVLSITQLNMLANSMIWIVETWVLSNVLNAIMDFMSVPKVNATCFLPTVWLLNLQELATTVQVAINFQTEFANISNNPTQASTQDQPIPRLTISK